MKTSSLILIVEDDQNTSQLLDYNLQKAGYETYIVSDGAQAVDRARELLPKLIILDQMLPNLDGLEICKILKREPTLQQIPIIFLTAKGEEIDRILGLELGAEDYVVKPFSPRELVLRIKTILNRYSYTQTPVVVQQQSGDIVIDESRHQVMVNKQSVELTALEFKLLVILFGRRGRVQSRQQLLNDVWEIATEIDTRTVDTHIKHLRQKLGKVGNKIETLRGVGYRFAEVD